MMKIISLFSGAGGLDLGFKKAGAKIVYANDVQKDFCATYRDNIGAEIACKDVKDVRVEEIPEGDAVIGGFPCLGFTVARGHRRKSSPREEEENFLYQEFLRVVDGKDPQLFLMENVPGIKSGKNFKNMFKKQIVPDCRKVGRGYNVEHDTLDSVHYGVPQYRKRIIILGVREDVETLFSPKGFFKRHLPRTHLERENARLSDTRKSRPFITLRQAIGDLPLQEDENIPNHVGTKHKVLLRNYPGNRKLNWDSPSPTITGRGSLSGGPVIHPHPSLNRRFTVRECARLQSFPDNFVFCGSMTKGYAQVGNAVPPLLAFRLAQSVMRLLGRQPNKYEPDEWEIPWSQDIPRVKGGLREKRFARKMVQYYEKSGRDFRWRKKNVKIYEFIIAELLLQRTRAEDVNAFLENFLEEYPSFEALAEANQETLEERLHELGLHHEKAKRIRKIARKLRNRLVEDVDLEELRHLPGVGEYMINALRSFYFDKDTPVLDSNVVRITRRVFNLSSEPDPRRNKEVRRKAESLLPPKKVKEYNYGLLDLGAEICKPNDPRCSRCPLSAICDYAQNR